MKVPVSANLYHVLEISRRASAQEIKRAYHALAHRCHPDKHPDDPAAAERFREASFAYAVLGDPARRKLYDRFGRLGLKFMPEPSRGRGEITPQGSFRALVAGLADELRERLEGFERRAARAGDGEDEQLTLNVTPALLLAGGRLSLRVRRPEPCGPCEGSGAQSAADRTPCRLCHGSGKWRLAWGQVEHEQICALCGGRGMRALKRCQACRGKGAKYPFVQLVVQVPAATAPTRVLRLAQQGGLPKVAGGRRGDLRVHLRPVADGPLAVDGHDLQLTWPLTPREAALGTTCTVPLPGGAVDATIPPGRQAGDRIEVQEGGLFTERRGRGRLVLTLAIEMPRTMDAAERAAWQGLPEAVEPSAYPARHALCAQLSAQRAGGG